MDKTLVHLRMHLTRNLKRLWFITTRNFSVPTPSEPHCCSRL